VKQLEVHLHTNNDCNLFCVHCYNKSGGNQKFVMPDMMQLRDTIKYICDNYDAEIHLEGGECFLHPEILKMLNTLPDDYLKSITITSNGTIMCENTEIINMLKRVSALRISVEGAEEEIHRKIRGDSLEKVLNNAGRYQKLGIPVWLRITLNRYNYDMFFKKQIIKLSERGFHKFQVYEFQSVGRGLMHDKELVVTESLDDFLYELENTYIDNIELKIMFATNRVNQVLEHKQLLEQKGYYMVELIPHENGISIHPNGDVYLCSWDNDPDHSICNWYYDKNARQVLENTNLTHICDHCSSIRIISKIHQ